MTSKHALPARILCAEAVTVSKEEEGDEGEYAVIRAFGYKVPTMLSPRGELLFKLEMSIFLLKFNSYDVV